jgi:hypothetical protein
MSHDLVERLPGGYAPKQAFAGFNDGPGGCDSSLVRGTYLVSNRPGGRGGRGFWGPGLHGRVSSIAG